MRFRITVRGPGMELRGYADEHLPEELAQALAPFVVVASPAEGDYDPFKEQELRELHHFETEQILERIKAARSNHPECEEHPDRESALAAEARERADALDDNWEEGDLAGAVRSAVTFLREVGDGDPVKCGWKLAVQDIDRALS